MAEAARRSASCRSAWASCMKRRTCQSDYSAELDMSRREYATWLRTSEDELDVSAAPLRCAGGCRRNRA